MTMRWIKVAAGIFLFVAVLTAGTILPERDASAQVQAVPRAGVAFNDTITQKVKIETLDPDDRTVAFTKPDGQIVVLPVASSAGNLANIADGSTANVTYTQVVTMLNLRQKGPGSQDARREQMTAPDKEDIASGRFTLTVVGVDLANNTVSVIEGRGGAVRTFKATSIAKQDMLKKIKVGDVVIGLTTPLMVTAITPAQ